MFDSFILLEDLSLLHHGNYGGLSLGMPFLGSVCMAVEGISRFPFYLYKVLSLKLLNDLEYNKAKISCNKLHKSFVKTIITVLLVHWNN